MWPTPGSWSVPGKSGGVPPVYPAMGAHPAYPGVAPGAMPGQAGVDWGMAAQQWLKNKEFYEQWQQQQYQQHLQMVASAHAAAIASIDPTVVNNPPPPPPLPTDDAKKAPEPVAPAPSSLVAESQSAAGVSSPTIQTPGQTSSSSPLAAKSKFKSRFSNSSLLKAAVAAVTAKESNNGDTSPGSSITDNTNLSAADSTYSNEYKDESNAKVKPLFAAYEGLKVSLPTFDPHHF